MESGPALILRTLDRHLTAAGEVRLFGGAAFVLGYGRDRTTDDADLADVGFLLKTGQLSPAALRGAIEMAVVPPEYAELFAAAKPKVLALLQAG